MSVERIQTNMDTMRTMEQIIAMKLMATRVYNPDFLERGTFRFQTTGRGRAQMMMSSTTLQQLMKESKTSKLMQWEFW